MKFDLVGETGNHSVIIQNINLNYIIIDCHSSCLISVHTYDANSASSVGT